MTAVDVSSMSAISTDVKPAILSWVAFSALVDPFMLCSSIRASNFSLRSADTAFIILSTSDSAKIGRQCSDRCRRCVKYFRNRLIIQSCHFEEAGAFCGTFVRPHLYAGHLDEYLYLANQFLKKPFGMVLIYHGRLPRNVLAQSNI